MSRAVEILMATRNGAAFLEPQLESFLRQSHAAWRLRVGDDDSSDATRAILDGFGAAHPGRLAALGAGPGRGSAANFLTLIADLGPVPDDTLVALSDQDDVWMAQRLGRAARRIARAEAEARAETGRTPPVVYAGRTVQTDAALRPVAISRPLAPRGAWFGNALVQNVLAGNTIVLNAPAQALLAASAPAALAAGVPHHDWWIYQVATGAGARIVLDPRPVLYYRQHGGNVIGAHRGLGGRVARVRMLANRDFSGWLDRNLAALRQLPELLTPAARATLEGFALARRQPRRLAPLGIRRQTAAGDRILDLLALSGRL